MKRIAALLTVYIRCDTTLRCLRELEKQKLPQGFIVDIYLTDDGCTDGTPQRVASEYPHVHIIKGNGNLYWNRGMLRHGKYLQIISIMIIIYGLMMTQFLYLMLLRYY